MSKTLAFEQPIVKLREKINELEEYTAINDVDLSSEIVNLKNRLAKLEKDIYESIKADNKATRGYMP